MRKRNLTPGIFTISGVLTAEECREMLALADKQGYEAAPITTPGGPVMAEEIRNNERVIIDDLELATQVWQRVKKHVPRVRYGRQVLGLNERIRFYRYTPGQRFAWHADGAFGRDNGELSLLTFMIYLNEGYQGGETRFESVSVTGKLGMALLFEHELFHEGAKVTAGVKYVFRSDVMYGPLGRLSG